MLTYSLFLIKCSPKKLNQLASQLKGEARNVLSFLHYCDRTKICTTLSKFIMHILNDVAAKFGARRRVVISECYTGRADIVARSWFAARGKRVRRKSKRSNLKLNVLLI